jgi:PBP1b-binding outer membrane lipoprotein LpoB
MKKKISVILLIAILLSSCGKKSDPIYNEENQNSKKIIILQIVLS